MSNTCTTNIVWHVNRLSLQTVPYSLDTVLPAFSDELAHELGLIDTELPFEEARQHYRINARALRFAASADFSVRIRQAP